MEIWKDIPGYIGFYQASNKGRVRSVTRKVKQHKGTQEKKGKILSPSLDRLGYLQCSLSKKNKSKSFKVHRLVALAFLKLEKGFNEVNHIDGVKTNNKVENLEWSNRSKNMKHAAKNGLIKYHFGDKHHKSKLTNNQVKEIRNSYKEHNTLKEYAMKYNTSISCISRIIKNETYKNL